MIKQIRVLDARYPFANGAGSDAVHRHPIYSYSVTLLKAPNVSPASASRLRSATATSSSARRPSICAEPARPRHRRHHGRLGCWQRRTANDEHTAGWVLTKASFISVASVTNACWDLWAKERGVPLWRCCSTFARGNVRTLDLSYLEDVLTPESALGMLRQQLPTRGERAGVVDAATPAMTRRSVGLNTMTTCCATIVAGLSMQASPR